MNNICPACGHNNRPGKRFCASCGVRLQPVCAVCGTENEADSRFCDECGAPLGSRAPAATAAPPDSPPAPVHRDEERRLVTVLFADVTGSTALGEQLDPEDVRSLMARYYEHARRVIKQHGGTLEKFIGDAVMAIFGLPQAHGDDPERALAAALMLREAVAQDPMLRQRVTLRTGVSSGEVVATSQAAGNDFLVTGDTVNTAARLQQSAQPGEILVSRRTHDAVRTGFLFGEPRSVEAKGKSAAVDMFPAIARHSGGGWQGTPLVGREEDLQQLSLLRQRALREGRPQMVSIVAPAGTGKTRMLEAFLTALQPGDGFQVATARCLPYGQTLTYWPLKGLLDGLLGAGYARKTVEEALQQGGHTPEDAARLADLVLATVGVDSEERPEGTRERESVFNAWQLLVESLGKSAPRIIVFEDLHWASDSLLDLVEHIMSPRTRAPLLIIATSRPELLDRRPGWGGGRQSFTALGLPSLDDEQTHRLVDLLGPGLTEPLRQRIAERSGGNPFFAIELVRIATEHAIGDTQQALDALPDTVHAAVLARLDLLSPAERAVLQAASVVGRIFGPATLRSVLSDRSIDLEKALDGLLARDMIVPSDEPGTFTFRHILIRDVAYGMLSRPERIRIHAGIATWLEAFAAGRLDEFVELIAYHYREAVQLARRSTTPLALPIEAGRAVRFLERAGELASQSAAFTEARSHLLGAIEIAPEAERPRLYEKLGDVASFGDWSIEAHSAALELWRKDGARDPLVGARLLRKMLLTYTRWQGSVANRLSEKEMIGARNEARRLAEEAGNEDELWRFRVVELFWPFWRGEITEEDAESGKEMGPAAIEYFERLGDWDYLHAAMDGYASILGMADDPRGTIQVSQRRLQVPGGTPHDRADAVNMIAMGLTALGQYGQVIDLMQATRGAMRPGDFYSVLGNGVSYAAVAACFTGRWDALPLFGDMLWEAWDELQRESAAGFLMSGFLALYHVALAREDRAASDAAGAALDRLVTPAARELMRRFVTAYRADDAALLDLSAWSSNLVALERYGAFGLMFLSERAARLPLEMLDKMERAQRAKNAAMIPCLAVARTVAAGDPLALSRAIEDAERHHLIPHAARMRIVLAQLSGDRAPLHQARETLQRLEDRQFLRRLEEVDTMLGTQRTGAHLST